MKITVVYNKNTKKIIPFRYTDLGEVEILDCEQNIDELIVSMIDATRLDLVNGYVLEEGEIYVEE